MDGRAVENLYREGRYEEIATYCLEDVRATAELYHKVAPTLLCWESNFRDAEARIQRARAARTDATQESLLVPSSEQPFLDSIAEGSELLASALEEDRGFGCRHVRPAAGKAARKAARDPARRR